jgi:hypothetical protein
MIRTNECSICRGIGVVEREEFLVLNQWIPVKNDDPDQQPSDGDPVRWADCQCPQCGGKGYYEVEYFPCKIF